MNESCLLCLVYSFSLTQTANVNRIASESHQAAIRFILLFRIGDYLLSSLLYRCLNCPAGTPVGNIIIFGEVRLQIGHLRNDIL